MLKNKKRLKSGETIVETLVAILIVTISTVILFNLTLTATKINDKISREDAKFREDLMAAEKAEIGTNGRITITSNGSNYNYEVEFFGKDNGLYSYRPLNGGA